MEKTKKDNKILKLLKKEPMLTVSVIAAVISLLITPPSASLLDDIDWNTLGTLFMMLTVLEGFKKEEIFTPLLRFSGRLRTMAGLSLFLVFSVFFSSMLVTNDVALIIFVPLTIMLFRAGKKEEFILPVITMENIAAIRGSMLTPFGSPQNLFIFGRSGVSAVEFILYMLPLWAISAVLLILFVLFLYRRNIKQGTEIGEGGFSGQWKPERKKQRIAYIILFVLIILAIVLRADYRILIAAAVAAAIFFIDRKILAATDYVLLLTFLCFFIFSSSVASNSMIYSFLSDAVKGNEYIWSILLSQVISNVPASIVLYPFAQNKGALLYGLDSAGLCSIIGSLASVINYRIYVREYPGNGMKFMKVFTFISLLFFAFVVLPGYFLSQRQL